MTLPTRIATVSLGAAVLCALPAWAEADIFGLGSGKDGALDLNTERVINAYAQVTEDVSEGATTVAVNGTGGFGADDLVLVWQTTGLEPAPASEGTSTPVDLSSTPVGRWELARVKAVGSASLTLTAPLLRAYAAHVSQVVRVPQYTTVTLGSEGVLKAQAWNGATGGIVAFLATGGITNNGRITASGAGFRGGVFVADPDPHSGCTGLDEASPSGGQRGEGIAIAKYGTSGKGKVANGGGGGLCLYSGAGGGGNGGAGGAGGPTSYIDPTQPREAVGVGGGALDHAFLERLSLGGAGGAAHGALIDSASLDGARGGGVIYFRARLLTGSGVIEANGFSAGNNPSIFGGGSGGGAGGSISVRLVESANCGRLEARGGAGSDVMPLPLNGAGGPGGGGGGGRVLLQAASLTGCNPNVTGGTGGGLTGSPSVHLGAGPGTNGLTQVMGTGLRIPMPPAVTAPANGSTVGTPRPIISGTAPSGARVFLQVDSRPVGSVLATASGFSFTPAQDLTGGSHQVTASVEVDGLSSPSSAPVTFTVDLSPPETVVDSPAEGATVTTRTPLITGRAEGGSTVKVVVDQGVPGTVQTGASGQWSFTPSSPLADGPHVVTGQSTDLAGNPGPLSEERHFTVDATAPIAPVIVAPAEGTVLRTDRPAFSGTAEAGSRVAVSVDGVPAGQVIAEGGHWSLTAAMALPEGSHTARATATDAVGNASDPSGELHFRVDATPPAKPTFTAPSSGALLTTRWPTFLGRAEAGSTVKLVLDNVDQGTTQTDASGAWSLTPSLPLADGNYAVQASATDAAGNSSALSPPLSFRVDATPPQEPKVTAPVNGARLATGTPTISGTAEAHSTVTIALNGIDDRTVTVDGAGAWSATTSITLATGTHQVSARATDAAGNAGQPSNTVTFAVDTQAPGAPVLMTPVHRALVNDATPLISGTAEPGSTVTVLLKDAAQGTALVNALGEWSFVPTAPLKDGLQQVSARATDAVGNTGSASGIHDFTVDTIAPATPLLVTPAPDAVVGLSFSTLTGTAEPGAQVLAQLDGNEAGSTLVDATGRWRLTLLLALVPGSHTMRVRARDVAGNTGEPTEARFTVDGTPPPSPVLVTPADLARLNVGTPTLTGQAEPGSTVEVFLNDAQVGSAVAEPSGAWRFTPPTTLGDADYRAKARAMDPSANVGDFSTVHRFTVDTLAPGSPVLSAPTAGAVLRDSKPRISGTAEPFSSITVSVDETSLGTVQADGAGGWSLVPAAPLEEGEHLASARATDAAGNTGKASGTLPFTVDSLAPGAPVVLTPAANGVLGPTPPSFTGRAEAGSRVEVFIEGVAVGGIRADVAGEWRFTAPLLLGDGTHRMWATATDTAGNTGPASPTLMITVDATSPAAPVLTLPVDGARLSMALPTYVGTSEPGATVTLFLGAVEAGRTVADAAGAWSLTAPMGLADGTYQMSARGTDVAGNTSPLSATVSFTVDTVVPDTIIARGPEARTRATEASFELSASESATSFECSLDSGAFAECASPLTLSGLEEGPHTLEVRARDAAGNVDPSPARHTWTVSVTASGVEGGGMGCATGGGTSLAPLGALAVIAWLASRRRCIGEASRQTRSRV